MSTICMQERFVQYEISSLLDKYFLTSQRQQCPEIFIFVYYFISLQHLYKTHIIVMDQLKANYN